jgi:hypothetical protein
MSSYSNFISRPSLKESFEKDLPVALANKQILLHMLVEGEWRFHLGAYTLADWAEGCTHEEFYQYFREIYNLKGDWKGIYMCYKLNILPIEDIDIRIQPKGRIPFGIIVIPRMAERILKFLRANLGNEHRGLRPWNSLGIGTKKYLANKATVRVGECISYLDALEENNAVFIVTKNRGKHDLLGGHAKLSELIDIAEHFMNEGHVENHLWPVILDTVNEKAFFREVAEELGLVPHPEGNIGDMICYHGCKTGSETTIWIRYIHHENTPVQIQITI